MLLVRLGTCSSSLMLEFLKEAFPRDSSITECCVYNYIMVACSPNGGSASTSEHEPHLPKGKGGTQFQAPRHMQSWRSHQMKGEGRSTGETGLLFPKQLPTRIWKETRHQTATQQNPLSFLQFRVSGGRWAVLGLGTPGLQHEMQSYWNGCKEEWTKWPKVSEVRLRRRGL